MAVRPSFAATGTSATGIVVPLYTYPTDSTWNTVIQVHNAHPSVPMIIIADPTTSGAGASKDPNFASGIGNMQAAGITVLGYVDTIYAGRGLTSAENDATNWWNWYHPDGIFFDEFGGSMTYYSTLNAFVKALGLTYTMGNPGTTVPHNNYGIVDSLIISENPSYPSLSLLSSETSGYPKSSFAYLAYGVSLNTSFEVSTTQYVSWLYITNDGGGNPWDTLPSYFSNEVAALDTGTTTSTTTTTSATSTVTSTSSASSTSTTTTSSTSSSTTSSAASGSLTVRSLDLVGADLTGMGVAIQANGVTVASGSTPLTFSATFGVPYAICVTGDQNHIFHNWGDGTTANCKSVTPTQPRTLSAYFSVGGQVLLTLQSADLVGSPTSGMWVLIKSNGVNITEGYTPFSYVGTKSVPYTFATDGYLTTFFNHWDDGTTSKSRSLTPAQDTVLTAYFGPAATTTTTTTTPTSTSSTSTSSTTSSTTTTTTTTPTTTTTNTTPTTTTTNTTPTTTATSTVTTTQPSVSTTTVTSTATLVTTTTQSPTITTSVTVTSAATSTTTQTSIATSTITQPFTFALMVTPGSDVVIQGASDSVVVSVSLTGGSPAQVALSATGAPQGMSVSFSPASGQAGFASAMHLVVPSGLSPGAYKITVVGQSNQIIQSQEFVVSVTAPQLAKYTLTTISSSGSGSITPTPSTSTHGANDLVTVRAAADSGWFLDHWLVNGVPAGNGVSLSLIMTGNVQVQAVFSSITQNGPGSSGTNASVSFLSRGIAASNLMIDGRSYPLPVSFDWPIGSTHVAAATDMPRAGNQTGVFFSAWGGSVNSTQRSLSFKVTGDSNLIANYQQRVLVSMSYTTSGGTHVAPASVVVYGPRGFETLGSANSTLWLDTNTRYTLVSAQVMGVNTVPLNQESASFTVTKPQSLTFPLSVYPVQLKLVDLFGQPIQGAQVELTTEGGQVLQSVTDGAGVANFDAVPSGWFEATYSYLGVSGHVQDSSPGPHVETATLAMSYPLISVGVVIAGAVALGGFRAWRRQRFISTAFD